MKLSILDQAPISEGQSVYDALQQAIQLAQLGDRLGYERYWIAEHHDLFGLACPNPSVMLGTIGAKTERIRLGAGAVLLPYYSPFHVAETYNLLATLFPERIDLGLGRAPGGSAEVSLALVDNYLEQVGKFPQQVKDLQNILKGNVSEEQLLGKITPTPVPQVAPTLWMLGTSGKSASLAATRGLSYAFGDFMTSENGLAIVQQYRDHFAMGVEDERAYVMVAVEVICAETTKEAEEIAASSILWKVKQDQQKSKQVIPTMQAAADYSFSEEEKAKVERMKQRMIIGNQAEVTKKLQALQRQYVADEIMIITITHHPEAKFRSYELIQEGAMTLSE